jgi:hypothetical protein
MHLPDDLLEWLRTEAGKNLTSINAEVVASIKQRVRREAAKAASQPGA